MNEVKKYIDLGADSISSTDLIAFGDPVTGKLNITTAEELSDFISTINTGIIQSVTVPISSAQLLTIQSSPVTILPAVPGKVAVIISVLSKSIKGDTNYTAGGNLSLRDEANTVVLSQVLLFQSDFNSGVANVIRVALPFQTNPPQRTANNAITLSGTANFATGNGTAEITLYYILEDVSSPATFDTLIAPALGSILPYTTYSAIVSQTGTNNPVPIVLENTTGATFTWTRIGVGAYRITATGAFPDEDKVFIISNITETDNFPLQAQFFVFTEPNLVEFFTSDSTVGQVEWHGKGYFEIRIYP